MRIIPTAPRLQINRVRENPAKSNLFLRHGGQVNDKFNLTRPADFVFATPELNQLVGLSYPSDTAKLVADDFQDKCLMRKSFDKTNASWNVLFLTDDFYSISVALTKSNQTVLPAPFLQCMLGVLTGVRLEKYSEQKDSAAVHFFVISMLLVMTGLAAILCVNIFFQTLKAYGEYKATQQARAHNFSDVELRGQEIVPLAAER